MISYIHCIARKIEKSLFISKKKNGKLNPHFTRK